MTHDEIAAQVQTRISDPLSINVRGFDGKGFEAHADEDKATVIPPVPSPIALKFAEAVQRAA